MDGILSVKVAGKNLNFHVLSDIYTVEGSWSLGTQEYPGHVIDLQQLPLTFDYLVGVETTNNLIHPEDLAQVKQILIDLQTGREVQYGIRIIEPDGNVKSLTGSGHLTKVNKISIAHLDEATTRDDLQLKIFQHAEQVSGIGTWTWNLNNNDFYGTENFFKLMGMPPFTGKINAADLVQFIHPDDSEKVTKFFLAIRKSPGNLDITYRILLPGNETKYLETRAETFQPKKGAVYVVGTTRDVTREFLADHRARRAEGLIQEEKKRAREKIREHESLMKEAEVIGSFGRYQIDVPTMLFFFSDNMYRLLGMEPGSATPTLDLLDSISNQDDANEARLILAGAIETKTNYQYTRRIFLPTGEMRYIHTYGKMIVDEAGKVTRVIGIARDITIQKAWEHATQQKEEQEKKTAYDFQERYFISDVGETVPDMINVTEIQPEKFPSLDLQSDITQKWKAEEALRESKQRFRSLVETYAQATWETTPDGIVMKDSSSWRAYTGQTLEDWKEYGWIRAIHPDDRAAAEQWWQDAVAAGRDVNADFRIYHPGAHYRWANVRVTPIRSVQGYIVKWLGRAIDINPRKEREQLLKELNEKLQKIDEERNIIIERQSRHLQKILNAIPQMVWVLDANAKVKFLNERWHSYTDLSEEAFVQMDARTCNVFHPAQEKEISGKWKYLSSGNMRYVGEVMIRNKVGEYRWHLDITESVLDEHGNVEVWVTTFTDVHDQFISEREARETHDLLHATFDASVDAIFVFSSQYDNAGDLVDFKPVYFNKKAANFFGEQNLHEKHLEQLLHKFNATHLFRHFKNVALSGNTFELEYKLDIRDQQKWFHITSAKLRDGIVITQRDITEQIESRENLISLNESLRQKNEALISANDELANFAFIANHDLREPLRKIQLFTSELIEKNFDALTEQSKGYSLKIIAAVKRMNNLIEDILTFSKISYENDLRQEVTDLNTVLEQVLREHHEVIQKINAKIISNKLPHFKCNSVLITHLLQNLVSNALKFSARDRTPEVTIIGKIIAGKTIESPLADAHRQYLKLEIVDNGIGFDEKYSNKIFGIFKRLHPATDYPGTGMGLAICKKIAESHGGFIVAKSTPGDGAAFTCYLPVFDDKE